MRLSTIVTTAILAVAATPSPAAAPDPFGPLAMIVAGLADGGKVAVGQSGAGKVTRSGPKAFLVSLPTGQAGFLYAQPQSCVFTQTSQMKGEPPLTVQFNLNLVTGIRFAQQGQSAGLNLIALQFQGSGEIVDFVAEDGTMTQGQSAASITTSLTVDQLNKAAAALRTLCPGS